MKWNITYVDREEYTAIGDTAKVTQMVECPDDWPLLHVQQYLFNFVALIRNIPASRFVALESKQVKDE